MDENRIRQILENYRLGKATEEELAFLESWYTGYKSDNTDEMPITERLAAVDYVWEQLSKQTQVPVKRLYSRRLQVAAAILAICIAGTTYLTWRNYHPAPMDPVALAQSRHDIAPGYNQAILTDPDGKTIVLDTNQSGIRLNRQQLAYDNGTAISNLPGSNADRQAAARTLTLQTPIGGTYQISLPDGSKVWLNTATTLRFPSTFNGAATRTVELTGEAYFEIAANASQPFKVNSRGQVVEVLGTSFNINNYPEEPSIKTTLINGSVTVDRQRLQPGEQAVKGNNGILVQEVNTEAVIGWKNNYIVFQDEKIESVMRTISRWYNVEVEYEGAIPADDFAGRVSRQAYVSQVLKKLELTNKVHFKIQGRKIIVTK